MRYLGLFALGLATACGSQPTFISDDAATPADTGTVPDGGSDASGSTDFVDLRDQQRYATVTLGGKTWFARNLNFEIAGSSFCYGDDVSNCNRDGRLYTWSVANTACPTGAHLPGDDEWKALETAVGMAADQLELEGYDTARGKDEGATLKQASGFGATMAGYRTGKTYEALNDRTYFWTSTSRGTDVWRRRIASATPSVFRFTNPPATFAISVRCVRD